MPAVPRHDVTWPKAKVTIHAPGANDVEYVKVRFVARDGVARLFDANGTVLAQGHFAGLTSSGKSAVVDFDDGSSWSVTKRARDCGCGG